MPFMRASEFGHGRTRVRRMNREELLFVLLYTLGLMCELARCGGTCQAQVALFREDVGCERGAGHTGPRRLRWLCVRSCGGRGEEREWEWRLALTVLMVVRAQSLSSRGGLCSLRLWRGVTGIVGVVMVMVMEMMKMMVVVVVVMVRSGVT